MTHYYTYILTNKYNSVLYVGVTNDLPRRLNEHKTKATDGFTKRYNINKLVYAEAYDSPEQAIGREKQIKGYTRQKKIDLINAVNPSWEEIPPF